MRIGTIILTEIDQWMTYARPPLTQRLWFIAGVFFLYREKVTYVLDRIWWIKKHLQIDLAGVLGLKFVAAYNTPNSASLALIVLKEAIATSSIFRSGSLVVRRWRARFGLMSARTKGDPRFLAVQRMYS